MCVELRANAEKMQKKASTGLTYFLRFQRMAGSENQVTIDEEAWELVLPDQWNLSGEHEKAIREGLEIFAQDINSVENERARKYFIIHGRY